MDTIAELLLARAGDGRPGHGGGRRALDLARGGGRERGPGRAGGRAAAPRGPSTWPPSSTTSPSTCCGWGRPRWPGRWWWAATPPTGGPTWPGTWPTPSASSSSPTAPISPSSRGSTSGRASARCRRANRRVLVVDDPAYLDAARGARRRRRSSTRATAGVTEDSLGYLIFTSGTSGAPKACRCTQGRLARIGIIVAQMFSLTVDDVVLRVDAAVPFQRAHGGPRSGPGRGRHRRTPHRRAVLGVGLPPRRSAPRRHLLQLRGQAAVLHPRHPRRVPTTPTTPSCGCSATKERRPTSPASASASAAWSSTTTGPPRAAPRAAHPRHAPRRAGPGARGDDGRRPRAPAASAPWRASTTTACS